VGKVGNERIDIRINQGEKYTVKKVGLQGVRGTYTTVQARKGKVGMERGERKENTKGMKRIH